MSKFERTVIFLIITFLTGNCISTNTCVQENSCLYNINETTKIDISCVVDSNHFLEDTLYNGTDKDTRGTITYYFSGCKNNILSKTNLTGSLIKYHQHFNSSTHDEYQVIGNASMIKVQPTSNESEPYQLVYGTGDKPPTVKLICNQFEIPFIKILDAQNDVLALLSPKVCPIYESHETHGLSTGSIFLIIFFVTSAIYFFGGALLLYYIRGARGLEIIPNIDFWKNLPGLVKDGTIFLLSGCKPTLVSTAETYDRI